MGSKKHEGTWADLLESLNQMRQQRGLVPRNRWDFLTSDARLNAHLNKQRNLKRALSSPFLPSLTDASAKNSINPRRGNKANVPVLEEWHNSVPNRKGKHRDSDTFFTKTNFLPFKSHNVRSQHEKESEAVNHFLYTKEFALDFVDSFISEILQDDLIPDVLIETLSQNVMKLQGRSFPKAHMKEVSQVKIIDVLAQPTSVIIQRLAESILEEVLAEVVIEVSVDAIRGTLRDHVDRHLSKTATIELNEDIVLETVQEILPAVIKEAWQEIESEKILDTILFETTLEEVKALIYSAIGEFDIEFLQLQKNQITIHADKQLIDMFFLEYLIDMIKVHGSVLFVKDPAIGLLDSFMVDILLSQYLSIQKQQEATLQNVPIAQFHQKWCESLALDVVLTELTQMMDEDMEDLFEYEIQMELGEFYD